MILNYFIIKILISDQDILFTTSLCSVGRCLNLTLLQKAIFNNSICILITKLNRPSKDTDRFFKFKNLLLLIIKFRSSIQTTLTSSNIRVNYAQAQKVHNIFFFSKYVSSNCFINLLFLSTP